MNKKQVTNIEVKKNNRNRVFRYICRQKVVSNPDISYELKMSLPTVTQLTKELIEKGLVEEKGELKSTGGRRAKALAVAAGAGWAAGLDITKNHISLVLTDLTGDMIKYERMYKPYTAGDDYYREVSHKLEHFLEESGCRRENLLGIGISFPGIIDLNERMITESHILGVRFLPFSAVSRFFDYPCHFLNDANAGAYAEGLYFGSGERFFYLSLSNTVGGAVFGSGRLEQGKSFRCGEAGHMTVIPDGKECYCGKKGCLDAYCSARLLSDAAGGKLDGFFEELKRGGKEAVRLWDEYTTYLAIAVNNIHMVLDCDIVLGGYVGSCIGEHIQDVRKKVSVRNTFEESGEFVRACRHKMGAAALGAAFEVLEEFIAQV